MPPALNTQNVIAFIWDFDKTLTPGYMQDPLFEHYGIDAGSFWKEVNALTDYYARRELCVSKDTVYLGHILSYIEKGPLEGLTNEKLRQLGAKIELAPGMPDCLDRMKSIVESDERFSRHSISVEHYIVSTGLKQMIEGNPIRDHVDGVWACELLSDPPGPGYLTETATTPPTLTHIPTQLGYVLDNTTKTRAIFEINKGANVEPGLDVNARMDEDERRVPMKNMIYIADGPSDVPVFSVVGSNGGRTLGVYTSSANYEGVKKLQDDGRVHSIAKADYRKDEPADMWLTSSLNAIATQISEAREGKLAAITAPAGHTV